MSTTMTTNIIQFPTQQRTFAAEMAIHDQACRDVVSVAKPVPPPESEKRDTTILAISNALKARSGKAWSVTGGTGTAWGWITIDAPPARRTSHCVKKAGATMDRPEDYEMIDTGEKGGAMTAADAKELAALMGLETVHHQGISIPSGSHDYAEHIQRARGEAVTFKGRQYWD